MHLASSSGVTHMGSILLIPTGEPKWDGSTVTIGSTDSRLVAEMAVIGRQTTATNAAAKDLGPLKAKSDPPQPIPNGRSWIRTRDLFLIREAL
jgi:hypothetical protein